MNHQLLVFLGAILGIGLVPAQDAKTVNVARGDEGSDWSKPFQADEHTVVLYHFDEGEGNTARDALGDPELTLRANRQALWGKRPGFGATARFERRDDDANLLIGPTNNDKLHLRPCTQEWTIEAWVRYTCEDCQDAGRTYANICGTEDEGFGLPVGVRGGWNFSLNSGPKLGPLKNGIAPSARFMGSPRGKDPNHDTSSLLTAEEGRFTGAEPALIIDNQWHHVAWQFRYRDQTHFFFLDGKLIRKLQLPLPGDQQGKVVNDAENVGVPFVVGGFFHSQDPPFYLNYGNFEGEIDEIRISKIMRYPAAERLSIIREELPVAGLQVRYSVTLAADAAQGDVNWEVVEGRLPTGLELDSVTGTLRGKATVAAEKQAFVIRATDKGGQTDQHSFTLSVEQGRIITESLPPAFPGSEYRTVITTEHMAQPVQWTVLTGRLPEGVQLDGRTGELRGTPADKGKTTIRVEATGANGLKDERELTLKVLPKALRVIGPDKHTVVLYDWQGLNGRLIPDVIGDTELALTWTNMGGDRRFTWPGREGRFPQDTGHGEHGWATPVKGNPKLDLKTCDKEWTVEAWVRRGGPFQAFRDKESKSAQPFNFGHICGTYDRTERGVWELYLSDINSTDGSMAPGVHFFGAEPDQALKDLHPWHRPKGIVGDPANAGIRDTEWHHVAWQYRYAEDLHQLFLDGELVWQMNNPDGRKLVNNRQHEAQFSVITRLNGYAKYGGGFNYHRPGNFFGQIGEIRISNVRRY
ncbi:MAG: putative Ig domain-containing protein [Planctomycetota bacterium]|nr:putative Ig domain-containing protein [Planctomycetota bacterium]